MLFSPFFLLLFVFGLSLAASRQTFLGLSLAGVSLSVLGFQATATPTHLRRLVLIRLTWTLALAELALGVQAWWQVSTARPTSVFNGDIHTLVAIDVLTTFTMIVFALWIVADRTVLGGKVIARGVTLLAMTGVLVGVFADTYLALAMSKGPAPFSQPTITNQDAVYISVTTLTSLGSGSLQPVIPLARLTVMMESLFSLLIVVVGITLVMDRFKTASTATEGSDQPSPWSLPARAEYVIAWIRTFVREMLGLKRMAAKVVTKDGQTQVINGAVTATVESGALFLRKDSKVVAVFPAGQWTQFFDDSEEKVLQERQQKQQEKEKEKEEKKVS